MIAATVLDRIFEPLAGLSPEAAQQIVDLHLELDLQLRLDELASRANVGSLSAEEHELYQQYVDGLDILAVLKAKASIALRKAVA